MKEFKPTSAAQVLRDFSAASDLHTTCQTCGKLRHGTLEDLKLECPCATRKQ